MRKWGLNREVLRGAVTHNLYSVRRLGEAEEICFENGQYCNFDIEYNVTRKPVWAQILSQHIVRFTKTEQKCWRTYGHFEPFVGSDGNDDIKRTKKENRWAWEIKKNGPVILESNPGGTSLRRIGQNYTMEGVIKSDRDVVDDFSFWYCELRALPVCSYSIIALVSVRRHCNGYSTTSKETTYCWFVVIFQAIHLPQLQNHTVCAIYN